VLTFAIQDLPVSPWSPTTHATHTKKVPFIQSQPSVSLILTSIVLVLIAYQTHKAAFQVQYITDSLNAFDFGRGAEAAALNFRELSPAHLWPGSKIVIY